jgi:hypothetical protein
MKIGSKRKRNVEVNIINDRNLNVLPYDRHAETWLRAVASLCVIAVSYRSLVRFLEADNRVSKLRNKLSN